MISSVLPVRQAALAASISLRDHMQIKTNCQSLASRSRVTPPNSTPWARHTPPEDGARHLVCCSRTHPALPAGLHQAVHAAHSQQVAVAQGTHAVGNILQGRAEGRVNIPGVPVWHQAAEEAGSSSSSMINGVMQAGRQAKGILYRVTMQTHHPAHCLVGQIQHVSTYLCNIVLGRHTVY